MMLPIIPKMQFKNKKLQGYVEKKFICATFVRLLTFKKPHVVIKNV
jgi:hypothetical protein